MAQALVTSVPGKSDNVFVGVRGETRNTTVRLKVLG